MIPANTYHQIVNISEIEDLKLYTIYSPPEHPEGKRPSPNSRSAP